LFAHLNAGWCTHRFIYTVENYSNKYYQCQPYPDPFVFHFLLQLQKGSPSFKGQSIIIPFVQPGIINNTIKKYLKNTFI